MDALILSNALDTNGQNQRYVRASRRWGTDPSVVKALAIGNYDPAAVVGRFQGAAEKFGNLAIRSVHRQTHLYQSMPADIVWTASTQEVIRRLALEADIIHLNNSPRAWQRLRVRRERPPFLLHHHGSLFRSNPRPLLDWARQNRAIQAVSTIDLLQIAPHLLHWLPTAYPIDELQAFGAEHRDQHDGIRVISAPTNRAFKSTEKLEAAVARLRSEGLEIELVLVENRSWAECMAIKASADIYFDQVVLGYGCNAIEAWGMGIPVIAGAAPWTLDTMRSMWGAIPFYAATEDTIADAIRRLAESKRLRTTWANRGLAHVRKYHDERPALTALADLYARAIVQQPEQAALVDPVSATFTAEVPQVRFGNTALTFSAGPVELDNPFLINRLRQYALRHPGYGIREVA